MNLHYFKNILNTEDLNIWDTFLWFFKVFNNLLNKFLYLIKKLVRAFFKRG